MILGIIQARISSSRFPGKVMMPILGEPMLLRQIERVRNSKKIDQILIATSTEPSDDLIENLCQSHKINCFRGSLNDVLDRYYCAAKFYGADQVVRLTGDCPLIDPQIIDQTINHHSKGNYDYTSNAIEPTFPDGLDVEVMTFTCLEEAWKDATIPSHREHVTRFFYTQPNKFKLGLVKSDIDFSHFRWTVDEPIDLELVNDIYQSLYFKNSMFTFSDVLEYLEKNPELQKINLNIPRNAGMQKSLIADQEFIKK
jgi:spore coat polysaccharide biosynthesis protein SpsF